jgi:UDP-3-O-[3-hydroxymyristoyl] glucosamine N-acyltransferase
MEFSAGQVAAMLEGAVDGNPEVLVNTLSKIEEGTEGSLSFLANPKYTEYIYTTKASIVIVNADFKADRDLEGGCTLVRVPDAYKAFTKLLEMYNQLKGAKAGIEQPSFIAETAKVGEGVYVGAFAYVGENAVIGNNVKLYPGVYVGNDCVVDDDSILYAGVKVYADCKIGKSCMLHSGAIIGADGFGFTPNSENNYQKVPQIGNVILEDHVEIGANTCIDRATLGHTTIRKGVKLDNLIQVAHNVDVGENTVIASQTGIAGSAKLGKNMMVGGQVGIVGHIALADEVKIAAQSGVGNALEKEGAIVMGSPAFDIKEYKKSLIMFKNLPHLRQQVKDLQAEVSALKKALNYE